MTNKKTLSGRVPPDTEKRFEEYRSNHDLSKSEALRRLLDKGLDASADDSIDIETKTQTERELVKVYRRSLSWAVFIATTGFSILVYTVFAGAGVMPRFLNQNIPIYVIVILILLFLFFSLSTIVSLLLVKFGIARWFDNGVRNVVSAARNFI